MPEFISCCNEPSRLTWLSLVARFKVKARIKARRNVTLKAKMESPEQIARLMTIKPGWNRSDGIQ